MFSSQDFLLAICHSVTPNGRVRHKKGLANCSYTTVCSRQFRRTAQAESTGSSAEGLHPNPSACWSTASRATQALAMIAHGHRHNMHERAFSSLSRCMVQPVALTDPENDLHAGASGLAGGAVAPPSSRKPTLAAFSPHRGSVGAFVRQAESCIGSSACSRSEERWHGPVLRNPPPRNVLAGSGDGTRVG